MQSLKNLLFVSELFSNNSVNSNSVNSHGINNLNSVNCYGVLGLSLLCTVSARSERNSCNSYEHKC